MSKKMNNKGKYSHSNRTRVASEDMKGKKRMKRTEKDSTQEI